MQTLFMNILHADKNTKVLWFFQITLGSFLLYYMMFPDQASELRFGNGFGLAKALSMLVVICHLQELIQGSTDLVNWIRTILGKKPYRAVSKDEPMIDGLPVYDLVDFLLKHRGLPVVQLKERFEVNNEQIKKLGDNLERAGIMGRGPNNSRILLIDDADLIVSIIKKGGGDSDAIFPALLQTGPSEYIPTSAKTLYDTPRKPQENDTNTERIPSENQ